MNTRFLTKPFLHRLIASLLLVSILTQLVFPLTAHALTAGPTAPEATSFEPVDTTDMVNLQSGDFTYNIPLLEVPGPEGGYPLSLSYHAGIQPNEEASWLGLGWTLNPGAITRNVNGYADDHKGIKNVVRDYWHGGERSTYNVGLTVGLANSPLSATFGLSFSQDTYQGFGTGASVGIGRNYGPFGAQMSVGANPYGGGFAGAGVNVGRSIGKSAESSLRLGAGLGVSTNFESISVSGNVGLSMGGNSVLGTSIRSTGGKPSLSVGGMTASVHNQSAGEISSSGYGFDIDIPIKPGLSVNLGYGYQRYWSDETSTVATFGTLYEPRSVTDYDNNAFDTYSLLDTDEDIVSKPDPEKVLGGSFPSYDNYYVTAQGLSGSMRPYWFRKKLKRQNKKRDGSYQVKQYNYRHGHDWENFEKPGFRFDNDFSNKFLYEGGTFAYYSSGDAPLGEDYFGPAPETGIYSPNSEHTNRLPGSRNIEWFTNKDIFTGAARLKGFVETSSSGFFRCSSDQCGDMIGGFMITNQSGVTYHYALPAYSYDEVVYTESVKRSPLDGNRSESFNSLRKPQHYAYTWYLTAITGPDYVDKNNNGLADAYDWGYWVVFDYGKWTDNYDWRNPYEGFHKDIDNNFQTYSTGKKELYYLDAIFTRTHTALFSKEIRNDGKGIQIIQESVCFPQNSDSERSPVHQTTYYAPRYTLRLNELIVLNNADINKIANVSDFAEALKTINTRFKLRVRTLTGQRPLDSSHSAEPSDCFAHL